MDGITETQTTPVAPEATQATPEPPADPWSQAFAALEQNTQSNTEAASDTANNTAESDVPNTEQASQENTANPTTQDSTGTEEQSGSSADNDRSDAAQESRSSETDNSVDLEQYKTQLTESIERQAVQEMSKAMIEKGIRNTNGILGATISDADICKRDEDGVPHFYNPETGEEFRGDNPRRQAQEWVDDYNRELKDVFNRVCADRVAQLTKDAQPAIQAAEFASTYKALDDLPRAMLDAYLKGHEVVKNDEVIGYNVDLKGALATVEAQIAAMRTIAAKMAQAAPSQPEVASEEPALAMKAQNGVTSGASTPEFKSVAEAMEFLQNQKLAKENK